MSSNIFAKAFLIIAVILVCFGATIALAQQDTNNPLASDWSIMQLVRYLLAGLAGAVAAYTAAKSHINDRSIHHPLKELDDTYVRKDVNEEFQVAIKASINSLREDVRRLEAKIDNYFNRKREG